MDVMMLKTGLSNNEEFLEVEGLASSRIILINPSLHQVGCNPAATLVELFGPISKNCINW